VLVGREIVLDKVSRLPIWSKAYPALNWRAQYKTCDEDFCVQEELCFDFDDASAEHLYLLIEKKSLTTYQLISLLSDYFNVEPSRVGYAGLKDKKALTQQWLSVYLPGKTKSLDIEMLLGSQLVTPASSGQYSGQCRILKACWHRAKLRRGAIAKNHFKILLRGATEIPSSTLQRLQLIAEQGFPNYFGQQRFGWQGKNLEVVEQWFNKGKVPEQRSRSILLSSARSFLFNNILQQRIIAGNWDRGVEGDCYMLQGSRKVFAGEHLDDSIIERCLRGDIHPCGSLFGNGVLKITAAAAEIEHSVLQQCSSWCEALQAEGLKLDHRALRCIPENLKWQQINRTDLELKFALASGSYATTLITELGKLSEFSDE